MTLDAATLFVACSAIDFVLALYFWALWLARQEQRSHLWTAASASAGSLGCLCYMLRGVAPDWVAVWAAQVCFIQLFAFLWAGVRQIHARAHPTLAIWAASILWTGACLVPALFAAESLRNVVATLCFTVYCLAMVAELLRHADGRAPLHRWLTAALLLAMSVASLLLTAYSASHSEVVTPLTSQSQTSALWLLAYTAIYITLVVAVTTLELGNEALRQRTAAATDALTGLLNRRAFVESAEALVGDERGMTLLLLDLDHFKQVNDRWGHAAGDRALVLFAAVLRDTAAVLSPGSPARIGGEEFGILLPGANREIAVALAQRIGACTRELRHTAGAERLTVSIGLATSRGGERSLDELFSAADEALYRAKRAGRDRVEQELPARATIPGARGLRSLHDVSGRAAA